MKFDDLDPAQKKAHAGLLSLLTDHELEERMATPSTYDGLTEEEINSVGDSDPIAPAMSPMKSMEPMKAKPALQSSSKVVDEELANAQQQAKERRETASVGQAVTDFTERPTNFLDYAQRLGGGGVSAPPAKSDYWEKYESEGNQAVKDLMARRASESEMAKKASAAAQEKMMNDPDSEESKFARSLIEKNAPGLDIEGKSAAQISRFAPFVLTVIKENGDLLRANAAAKAKAEADVKKEADQKRKDAEGLRRFEISHKDAQDNAAANRAIAGAGLSLRAKGEERDARKFAAEEAEKAKGKPLTDTSLMDLADTDTALRSLGELGEKFVSLGQEGLAAKVSGKVSGALGLTSTDAGQYLSAAKLSMQGVGKIMEGGKLAQGDETKYMGMLPVPGDSFESAAIKIKSAQSYLRGLRDDRVTALKRAGRNVPSFDGASGAASGTVTVTNGTETLDIDASDLADAIKDGFHKVGN